MNSLEKARALVKDYPLVECLKKNGVEKDYIYENEYLSESLYYSVVTIGTKTANESDITLGTSKKMGVPHLPKNVDWPKGYHFLAQFNFEELKEHDLFDVLPKTGILYLFFDPYNKNKEGQGKLIYFNGNTSELEMKEYPDKEKLAHEDGNAYYYGEYKKPSKIDFAPGFSIGRWDEQDKMNKVLPQDLKDNVAKILGCISHMDRIKSKDHLTVDSGHIFGQATFLEPESEFDVEDKFQNEGYDIDDFMLLYDFDFADSYIHFWIHKEDVANHDFSKLKVSASIG